MICAIGKRLTLGYFLCVLWISRIHAFDASDLKCGKPGRNPDTQYVVQKNAYRAGEEVRYSCSNGSLLYGSSLRRCLENGSWLGRIPECYKPVPINGARHRPATSPQRNAQSIDGNINTCISTEKSADASWEGRLATAIEMKALSVVFPSGASINIEVVIKENETEQVCGNYSGTVGQSEEERTVVLICPKSTSGNLIYVRDLSQDHHNFRICEVTAFRPSVPHCLSPDFPLNAKGLKVSSISQTKFRFVCDEGYKRWGRSDIFCRADGTWSTDPPICKKIYCSLPTNPENGYVFHNYTNLVPYNGRVYFACNPGYILNEPPTVVCARWEEWSPGRPTCFPNTSKILAAARVSGCGNLTHVANGRFVADSTSIGSTASLICNEGFRPLSDSKTYCLENGKWKTASFTCALIECEQKPVVPYGEAILLDSSTTYGSKLQIICNRGYISSATIIRTCELSGSWGDLNVCIELTCGSLNINQLFGGHWLPLNNSIPIRVLVCDPGYHIEGSPAVTQCLSNGSWSYTTAVCRETPEANEWGNEWSPNLLLMIAIAVGAGTAVCILCLALSFIVLKKRHQSKINTTVFHDAMDDSAIYISGAKENNLSPKQYYTKDSYENTIELRQKCGSEKARKPRSALPHLPIDADPVYAQPFETASEPMSKEIITIGNKDDLYNAHIYAEPVDSGISSSSTSYVNTSMAEAWFQTGTGKFGRKMSLPNSPPIMNDTEQSISHNESTIHKSSCHYPVWSNNKIKLSEMSQQAESGSEKETPLCALIDNSIYLESGNPSFTPHIHFEPFLMTENDIYLDEHFSNV